MKNLLHMEKVGELVINIFPFFIWQTLSNSLQMLGFLFQDNWPIIAKNALKNFKTW